MYKRINMIMFNYKYVYIYIVGGMNMYIYMCIYIYICVYIYVYIYIYVYNSPYINIIKIVGGGCLGNPASHTDHLHFPIFPSTQGASEARPKWPGTERVGKPLFSGAFQRSWWTLRPLFVAISLLWGKYNFYGVKPSFLYKKDGFTPWTNDFFPRTMDDFQRSIGFS